MALTAGQTGHLADHTEHPQYVKHGATASTARPTLGSAPTAATVCIWDGSVDPDNKVSGDYWWDTANDVLKRYDGSAWVASGSATYQAVPDYTVGDYVQLARAGIATTVSLTDQRLYLYLAYLPADVDRLGVEVTSAGSGGTFRIGAYAATSGRPAGAPLVDAGTVDLTSATAQEVTLSLTGDRWVYIAGLAENVAGSPAVRAIRGMTATGVVSLSNALGFEITGWQQNSVTAGSLPTIGSLGSMTTAPKFVARVA